MVINMKRNSKIKILIMIVFVISVFLFSEYREDSEIKSCSDISDIQARQEVKIHFMDFISRAPFIQKEVGTTDIIFTWGGILRETDSRKKLLGVSFYVKGNKGGKHLIAIYTCSNGQIEYSIDPDDDFSPSGSDF